MASQVRQARRLTEQIEERVAKENALRIRGLEEAVDEAKRVMAREVALLNDEVRMERLKRVSAQRGLVAYMQEHGLGDRIGYNPDEDPLVIEEIKAGFIPSLGIPVKRLLADRHEESLEKKTRRELKVVLSAPRSKESRPRPPRRIRRAKAVG